jgi:hypothetical protein
LNAATNLETIVRASPAPQDRPVCALDDRASVATEPAKVASTTAVKVNAAHLIVGTYQRPQAPQPRSFMTTNSSTAYRRGMWTDSIIAAGANRRHGLDRW